VSGGARWRWAEWGTGLAGEFIRGGEWMNSVLAIDLKEISGGNRDQNIFQCLFDSAGFAGCIA
jgi:hypothetical protein